jgi:DNA mismatch repair protein MutS
MTFRSILFERTEDITQAAVQAPNFFLDLDLDQTIDAITAGKEEYNLKPFFYTPLSHLDAIRYRHEIMRELENKILFEHIRVICARNQSPKSIGLHMIV